MFPTFIHVTRLQHTWSSSQEKHFTACLLTWYKFICFTLFPNKSWRGMTVSYDEDQLFSDALDCMQMFFVQLNHYHNLILCIFELFFAEEWVTSVWRKLCNRHCMRVKGNFWVLVLSLACGLGLNLFICRTCTSQIFSVCQAYWNI